MLESLRTVQAKQGNLLELKVVTKGRKARSPRKRDKVLPQSATLEPEQLELKFDSPDKVPYAATS